MSVAVSATLIVRNEERFLPGCLAALAGRVEEIVVVDTGSTDATRDIASQAGARLLQHEWSGDFAAARNVAMAAATGEWVLYIDADERLLLPRGGRLGDYVDPGAIAGLVSFRPRSGYTRYREWRLFRNDPRLRFSGIIHETMKAVIREISAREGLPIVGTGVWIDHLGYEGDQSHKHARNLPLLREALRAMPGRAYCWHHLAETLSALGQTDEALDAARTGLATAGRDRGDDDQRAAVSLLIQFIARTAISRGESPVRLICEGLMRLPEDYFLWFLLGRVLLDTGQPLAALRIAESLRRVDPDRLVDELIAFDQRIFGEKACELAGAACFGLGRRSDGAAHFAEAARLSVERARAPLPAGA